MSVQGDILREIAYVASKKRRACQKIAKNGSVLFKIYYLNNATRDETKLLTCFVYDLVQPFMHVDVTMSPMREERIEQPIRDHMIK